MKNFTSIHNNLLSTLKVGYVFSLVLLTLSFKSLFAQKIFSSAVAYSSAAIDINGNLYVWGNDQYLHPVVSSTVKQDSTPVMAAFPSGVTSWTSAAVGQNHMVALGNDGNLYACGLNNHGQLGNGTTQNDSTPVMVTKPSGVTSWTAIACGASHNIAIGNDGKVYVWGYNSQGQLADSALTDKLVPTLVNLPSSITVTAVSATYNTCLAFGSDGNIYAWGKNANGQLGNGTTIDHVTPVIVNLPIGVTPVSIASGGYFNTCLGNDGNIYGWGQGNNGQIGNGSTTPSNVLTVTAANKPSGVTSWKTYTCGASFVLAIGNNDSLYAWGYGGTGEMGNGTTNGNNTTINKPSLSAGVTPVKVAAGHNHGFIFDQNDSVYAWGRNSEGQLGANNLVKSTTPVLVTGLSGTGNLVLPVELTSFAAASAQNGVLLRWKTATENNNSGFEVERSSDNQTFVKVGFIKGNGTSSQENEYSYLDKNVSGKLYYKLNQIDFNGTSKYSKIIEVDVNKPMTYKLEQNYPNPFNPTTVINYSIPKDGFVSMKIYNSLGQVVATLYQGFQKEGSYQTSFDASKLSSGIYLYQLQANGFTQTKKMILMK